MFDLLEKRKNVLTAAEHIVRAAAFAIHGAGIDEADLYDGADDALVKWITGGLALLDDLEGRVAFYGFLDETPVDEEAAVEAEIEKRRGAPEGVFEKYKTETAEAAGISDKEYTDHLVKTLSAVLKQEAEIAAALIEQEKEARGK